MLLKAFSVREARMARAAEDADEERQALADAYRREQRKHRERLLTGSRRAGQSAAWSAAAQSSGASLHHEVEVVRPVPKRAAAPSTVDPPATPPGAAPERASPPPSDSAALSAFLDAVPLSQVVAAAVAGQMGGEAGAADFRALTRPQLNALLRACRLEGLGPALWEALLRARFEQGELLSHEELAQIQSAQGE